jgi:hypothetical protein
MAPHFHLVSRILLFLIQAFEKRENTMSGTSNFEQPWVEKYRPVLVCNAKHCNSSLGLGFD